MVAPQVQPLQNPFDDAAFYLSDTELISENIETILTVNDVNKDDSANTDNHQTLLSNDYIEQNSNKPHTITSDTKAHQHNVTKRKSHETIKQQYFKAKLRKK
ncbi:unnamed protein product [Parnassius mnemosyne]|uniref:Uncharacterized protein n=1 Tax=Parnassius mnemosyne TaxID=213953 RepID=A0AAV1KZY4_9NEOP